MNAVAKVSFPVERLSEYEVPTFAIVPVINGNMLTDLIAIFERDRHFEPAGGYAGLVPQFFEYGHFDRYLMGEYESDSYWAKLGGIYLLGCDCGEVGCWPLVCRVMSIENTVVWGHFRQPHRPERDYSEFGPFVFDAEQYRRAVEELQANQHSASTGRLSWSTPNTSTPAPHNPSESPDGTGSQAS